MDKQARSNPKSAREVVARLADFAYDPEEVATMTPEQVQAELEAAGVDTNLMGKRLRERLEQLRKGTDEWGNRDKLEESLLKAERAADQMAHEQRVTPEMLQRPIRSEDE